MRGFAWRLVIALAIVTAGCGPAAGTSATPAQGRIEGVALAGPTCPVVTDPPQSGCDDRPVAGAMIDIVDAAGTRIAVLTTDASGRFEVDVAPGTYAVRPKPVEGLLGTALPISVTVAAAEPASVTISYDTGIR